MYLPAVATRLGQAQRRVSRAFNLPAPVGGINARDAYTDMSPEDAVNLVNVFPEANYVTVRRGHAQWATGIGQYVQTILVWQGLTGVDQIFGASGAYIYDGSASGTATVAVSGLTSAKWQWTNIETAGGMFLIAVNGADTAKSYDGTTWATPAITGVSSDTFVNVCQFKERLWFAQDNSLDLWYLGTQSIAGAATVFPMGSVFRRGGYVIGLGSFSRDAGEGPDDFFVIATNNGEVAVYQGTNPDSATTWSLVGIFTIGKPIGRRSMTRINGDLSIITQDGVVSMQAALQFDRSAGDKATITSKIQTLFGELSRDYFNNFGWQPCVYSRARYLIVNVPQVQDMTQIQLVMNTVTGSWCRFEGMNAECWAVANDLLYFGGNDGIIYQANDGYTDSSQDPLIFVNNSSGVLQFQNGTPQNIYFTVEGAVNIEWEIQTSWQNYKQTNNKYFTMVRPLLLTGGGAQFAIGVDVDFVVTTPTGTLNTGTLGGMIWTWTWPGTWGGQNVLDSKWQSCGKIGNWASVHLKGIIRGAPCNLNAIDLVAQTGGVL